MREHPEDHQELSQFHWFVKSGKFPTEWWMSRLKEAAQLVVCRGFGDVVEGGSSAAGFGDDLFGGTAPDEGLWDGRSSVLTSGRWRRRALSGADQIGLPSLVRVKRSRSASRRQRNRSV